MLLSSSAHILGRGSKGTKPSLQRGVVSADPPCLSQVSHCISTICCPLGHFGTAAWLQCQLVTGSMAWSDSVSEGGGGGEGEGRREHTQASSQRRLTTVFFH